MSEKPNTAPDPLSNMAEGLRIARHATATGIIAGSHRRREAEAALDLAIRVAEIIGPFARGFRQWVRIVARVEI